MSRLGDKDNNYVKPKKTFTDQLTKDEIKHLLEDYEEVKDIKKLMKGTHIRYFENKDGEYLFRMGGIVTVIKEPLYIVLSNGTRTWSVQLKEDTILFSKLSASILKKQYLEALNEKQLEINELIAHNKKLIKTVNKQNKLLAKHNIKLD
jgi:hypothetical protein